MPAVPNLWVATPSGVAINLIGVATGRQTLKKSMHNCIFTVFALVSVKKLCSVKYSSSNRGLNQIKASSTLALVENCSK